jgi:hypothetical protein
MHANAEKPTSYANITVKLVVIAISLVHRILIWLLQCEGIKPHTQVVISCNVGSVTGKMVWGM